MTSSGLGFIDEQNEDGGVSFSPGSITPSINAVNNVSAEKLTAANESWIYDSASSKVIPAIQDIERVNNASGSEKLNTLGQLWAYDSTTGTPQATSNVRINPNFPEISFNDNKYRLYQTNGGTVSVQNLNNTGDVQIQILADTNNVGEENTSSVLFGGDGVLTAGYVGFVNNTLSFVSKSSSAPAISLYVDTTDFIETNSVKKPSTVSPPTPAIYINSSNIPRIENGLTFGGVNTTFKNYREEIFQVQWRSYPSDTPVNTSNVVFTQVGRVATIQLDIIYAGTSIVPGDNVLQGIFPSYTKALGSTAGRLLQSILLVRSGLSDVMGRMNLFMGAGGAIRCNIEFLNDTDAFEPVTHTVESSITYTLA